MRNLKKLLAVVVTVAMLAAFALPVIADDMTDADICETVGMLVGEGQGVTAAYLASTPARWQAAVLFLRLLGLEDAALAYTVTDNFTDAADMEWVGGRSVLAYLYDNPDLGFNGYPDGTFKPNQTISAQEYYKVILTALGYVQGVDFEWADVFTFAASIGLSAVADVTNFTVNDLAIATVEALQASKKGSTTTLISDLVAAGSIDAADAEATGLYTPAPTTVEATGATASNLKEIVVVFNTAVDEDAAETAGNYTLDGADSTDFTATLNADGMSVTLTENSTNAAFGINQDEIDITVSDEVVDTETTVSVTLFDATVPVCQSVELKGPNKFDIIFSEPIDADVAGTVEIDNGIYGIDEVAIDGTNTVTVTLLADELDEGDYEVSVSGFEDFAGYTALDKTLTLDYVVDDALPTASVDSADQTEVVIVFNKAVTDSDGTALTVDYFYHTYTAYAPSAVAVDGNTTFTLDFTNNPLQEGTVNIVIDVDANDKNITDEWGNELTSNIVLPVQISADKIAPEITGVTVESQGEVTLAYSEKVIGAGVEANYTITDADDEEVTGFAVSELNDDNEVSITVGGDGFDPGTYTIVVSDVTDDSVDLNEIADNSNTFTIEDETRPDLSVASAVYIENVDDEDIIYVTFPEEMKASGNYSVLDKDNYLVSDAALGDDDTIELFGTDGDMVKITIADESVFDLTTASLKLGRLADAQGNTSVALQTTVPMTADVAPVVTAVETVNENTIKITVNDKLSSVNASGIIVAEMGDLDDPTNAALAARSFEIDDDGNTIITATLKSSVKLAGSDDTSFEVIIKAESLKSIKGKYMAQGVATTDASITIGTVSYATVSTAVAVDGYAPSIDTDNCSTTVAAGTNKTIDLAFDENVKSSTGTAGDIAHDLVVTYDGDVLTALTDYTVAIVGGDTVRVTIRVETEEDTVISIASKASPKYLVDDPAGNDVNAFDAVEIEVE